MDLSLLLYNFQQLQANKRKKTPKACNYCITNMHKLENLYSLSFTQDLYVQKDGRMVFPPHLPAGTRALSSDS